MFRHQQYLTRSAIDPALGGRNWIVQAEPLSDAVQRNDNNKSLGPTQDAIIKDVNEKLDEIFFIIVRKAI